MTFKHTFSLPLLSFILTSVVFGANAHAKGAPDVDISGYLMLDYDDFNSGFSEDNSSSTNESDIRRARLSFKADLLDDWTAKLQLAFEGDETEIKDAYAQYKGWRWADLKIGQQKEPFGLEKLTSSRNLLMIERSIVTDALSPGDSIGIALNGEYSTINWQLGYFLPEETESAYALTGRLIWLPWQIDNNLLHLGVAFSERELNNSEFRVKEQMEVYFSDSLIKGDNILADNNSMQSLELLWQINGKTTMAEWQQASVTDINSLEFIYRGGYLQIGYQLSGNNRGYKNGTLGSAKNSGWELVSRYSHFKLSEEDQKSEIYSIGVNYVATSKLQFKADYINAKQVISGIELNSDDAVSLRMQYSF